MTNIQVRALPSARTQGERGGLGAYLFLAPAFLFFAVFTFLPIAWTILLSLQQFNMFSNTGVFIGLGNYAAAIHSAEFWQSFWSTFYYAFATVPVTVALALVVASILNWRDLPGARVLQTLFFLPYIVASVGSALVWTWIYDTNYGVFNTLLHAVGLGPVAWLTNPGTAMPALIIMSIWGTMGFPIVLFRAGLKAVPVDVQESASIDGASPRQIFWRITFPLLTPTTLFVLVISIINAMQVFTVVEVMTQGGPLNATNVLVYYIFKEAFQFFNLGYGSAVAVVLFAVTLVLTGIQIFGSRRLVYYEGEAHEH